MNNETFHCQCITDTIEGLRDGLSHFSQPSRGAILFALKPQDPMRVYDPQNLLQGHEPKFRKLYLDNDDWRQVSLPVYGYSQAGHISPEDNLELTGLISFGARSASVFYQMWFTEHHPEMCSVGPTERWLEHAAWRLSHDVANRDELYTGISGSFLREYATHAVRDHLVDEINLKVGWDSHLRIYDILDAVLGISYTREEGAWARGRLAFAEPGELADLDLLVRFPAEERPRLERFKHVRKLLQAVENSDRLLVSDGRAIVGIATHWKPRFWITADFQGRIGFLHFNGQTVCSFCDGSYHSTTHRAKLVQLEEALLESRLDSEQGSTLYRIVTDLVHQAERDKFGCTLVVDLNPSPVTLSGQNLDPPLDLRRSPLMDLATSLARVDGALHIGADQRLHRFACLLDGLAIAGEDRARGARFNSALRFTAAHPDILVMVVSSDRPVSIIQEGVELNAHCQFHPVSSCTILPPTLTEWLAAAEEGD